MGHKIVAFELQCVNTLYLVIDKKSTPFAKKYYKISKIYLAEIPQWQGWQDLNLRILESKSSALPLGYTPKGYILLFYWQGWKDLNPRILESESSALPLGDTPKCAPFNDKATLF